MPTNRKEYMKSYREKNRYRIKQKQKEYEERKKQEDPEGYKEENRVAMNVYREKNHEGWKEYQKKYHQEYLLDPINLAAHLCRVTLRAIITKGCHPNWMTDKQHEEIKKMISSLKKSETIRFIISPRIFFEFNLDVPEYVVFDMANLQVVTKKKPTDTQPKPSRSFEGTVKIMETKHACLKGFSEIYFTEGEKE